MYIHFFHRLLHHGQLKNSRQPKWLNSTMFTGTFQKKPNDEKVVRDVEYQAIYWIYDNVLK